jgi:hypothetical protein
LATTAAIAPRQKPRSFPLRHPWDRYFFPVFVLLIWAAIVAGFGPEIVRNYQEGAAPKPAMVRLHGFAFVGWLVLLTVQLVLIRKRKVRLHRRIGIAGAVLAVIMVMVGLGAALTVQSMNLGRPGSDPGFFSVQFIDMIEFGGLVAAAISARNQPAAHKRLILLATLSIVDAGTSRWLGIWLLPLLGEGYLQFWIELFGGTALLIAAIGAYDLVTRRRLHPAYVFGALWIFAGQITASWLYYSPGWRSLATSVIKMWP